MCVTHCGVLILLRSGIYSGFGLTWHHQANAGLFSLVGIWSATQARTFLQQQAKTGDKPIELVNNN